MDTEIKTLAQIKAMSGRNLDSSVNDSTLVSGETSAGTFGVFKFFQGIKNFFKNAQALATLTATSRITVTDADGNVTYTTPNAIKSTLGLATTSELNSAIISFRTLISDFNFDPTTLTYPCGFLYFDTIFNPSNKPTAQNYYFGYIMKTRATSQYYIMVGWDYLGTQFKRRYNTTSGTWTTL